MTNKELQEILKTLPDDAIIKERYEEWETTVDVAKEQSGAREQSDFWYTDIKELPPEKLKDVNSISIG